RLPEAVGAPQRVFWQGVYEVMMRMTRWVMLLAPVGVFGLVARTLTVTGFSALAPLLGFFFTVLLALAVHLFVTLPVLLATLGRTTPWRHLKAMGDALLTAFNTSSSHATLPKSLECLEAIAGVPRRVSGFVARLVATI